LLVEPRLIQTIYWQQFEMILEWAESQKM